MPQNKENLENQHRLNSERIKPNNSYYADYKKPPYAGMNVLVLEILMSLLKNNAINSYWSWQKKSIDCTELNLNLRRIWNKTDYLDSLPRYFSNVLMKATISEFRWSISALTQNIYQRNNKNQHSPMLSLPNHLLLCIIFHCFMAELLFLKNQVEIAFAVILLLYLVCASPELFRNK